MKSIFVFLLGILACANSLPTNPASLLPSLIEPLSTFKIAENIPDLPPVDSSVFGNDVVEDDQDGRSGIIGNQYRWNGQINFQIGSEFVEGSTNYNNIYSSLQELAGVMSNCLGVGLWPQNASPSGDYVYITSAQSGCFSSVGRRGGRQNLNLQTPGCNSQGTIVHEMIHAVGFHHEQIRPDRDSFINILWGNIQSGTEHNFQTNSAYPLTFNIPYDYYSIMHYEERAFSSNGGKTIEAKQSGIIVGSRGVVTDSDRRKLRAMYSCSV